jgi:hypothetical protein
MVHRLQLGNQHFALTDDDVEKLDSPFLSALLNASTPFSKPDDGIYQIDADAQCFASFLVLAQYGRWMMIHDDRDFCLQQADFWGIREKIKSQISTVDHNKTLLQQTVATLCSLREKLTKQNATTIFGVRTGEEMSSVRTAASGTLIRLWTRGLVQIANAVLGAERPGASIASTENVDDAGKISLTSRTLIGATSVTRALRAKPANAPTLLLKLYITSTMSIT